MASVNNPEAGIPVASENVYSYRTGLVGGLVAGVAMALAMALWGALSGNGVWYPVNMIAATLIRDLQFATPATLSAFMPAAALVGTVIHVVISITLGLIFASVLPTLPGSTLLWGVIVGLLLWAGAQYAILPLLNPTMGELVSQPTFVLANVAYSVILGWWVSRGEKMPLSR